MENMAKVMNGVSKSVEFSSVRFASLRNRKICILKGAVCDTLYVSCERSVSVGEMSSLL